MTSMTGHYDARSWCQCECPICAPFGCGRAGTIGIRGCDNWRADNTPKHADIKVTDKRADT